MIVEAYNTLAGPCDHDGCTNLAIGGDSFCYSCSTTFCRDHYDADEHSCRYDSIYLFHDDCTKPASLEDLDEKAVVSRAEQLRPGHTCSVIIPRRTKDVEDLLEGWYNIHLILHYDDGLQWLVRIPGLPYGPRPSEIITRRLESEVVTYETVREMGLPVAQVHAWGVSDFSKTGDSELSYLIYDRMPGDTCDFVIDGDFPDEDDNEDLGAASDIESGSSTLVQGLESGARLDGLERKVCQEADALEDVKRQSSASIREGKDRLQLFVDSYVANSIKLASRTFNAIGSLTRDKEGQVVIGPAVDYLTCDSEGRVMVNGPFRSLREHYLSVIEDILALLVRGLIYREGLLLPFLTHLDLYKYVESCEAFALEETDFYIEHPDPHDGNFLFDDGEISAMVDWVGTVTTTKRAAFVSPAWARGPDHWTLELSERELMLCASYERAGRPDLAECVREGRMYQVGRDLLDTTDWTDSETILATMNNIAQIFGSAQSRFQSLGEWGLGALERHKDDSRLQVVLDLDQHLAAVRQPSIAQDPVELATDLHFVPHIRWTPELFRNDAETASSSALGII